MLKYLPLHPGMINSFTSHTIVVMVNSTHDDIVLHTLDKFTSIGVPQSSKAQLLNGHTYISTDVISKLHPFRGQDYIKKYKDFIMTREELTSIPYLPHSRMKHQAARKFFQPTPELAPLLPAGTMVVREGGTLNARLDKIQRISATMKSSHLNIAFESSHTLNTTPMNFATTIWVEQTPELMELIDQGSATVQTRSLTKLLGNDPVHAPRPKYKLADKSLYVQVTRSLLPLLPLDTPLIHNGSSPSRRGKLCVLHHHASEHCYESTSRFGPETRYGNGDTTVYSVEWFTSNMWARLTDTVKELICKRDRPKLVTKSAKELKVQQHLPTPQYQLAKLLPADTYIKVDQELRKHLEVGDATWSPATGTGKVIDTSPLTVQGSLENPLKQCVISIPSELWVRYKDLTCFVSRHRTSSCLAGLMNEHLKSEREEKEKSHRIVSALHRMCVPKLAPADNRQYVAVCGDMVLHANSKGALKAKLNLALRDDPKALFNVYAKVAHATAQPTTEVVWEDSED